METSTVPISHCSGLHPFLSMFWCLTARWIRNGWATGTALILLNHTLAILWGFFLGGVFLFVCFYTYCMCVCECMLKCFGQMTCGNIGSRDEIKIFQAWQHTPLTPLAIPLAWARSILHTMCLFKSIWIMVRRHQSCLGVFPASEFHNLLVFPSLFSGSWWGIAECLKAALK